MTTAGRFERRREDLVSTLREKGIADENVLQAVGRVPRHAFVDHALLRRAYHDEALPIGLGQTISQPFTVAYQTVLLGIRAGDRVLEIGTGSGYQAAILCELGAKVFSIERLRPLYVRTRHLLRDLGYQVTCRLADGSRGWEAKAPFDSIVVTAGAHSVPEPLLRQLREPEGDSPGGRLVIPVGGHAGQTMNRIVRTGSDSWDREKTDGFRFVPLVAG